VVLLAPVGAAGYFKDAQISGQCGHGVSRQVVCGEALRRLY